MAYSSKTFELIMKAQQVSHNEQQTKQFTTFQQFFKAAQLPPQLFEKEKQVNTPKQNIKIQRSLSNKTMESIRDTKRKSTSQVKYAEYKLLKIYSRFRPRMCQQTFYQIQDNSVIVDNSTFTFDQVFDCHSTQEEVYEIVAKPTIIDFLNKTNGTILTYGQTGSGKTFTMFGEAQNPGIVARSLTDILNHQISVSISILEIYKDNVYDLIAGNSSLKVKEDSQGGFFVERLQKIKIETQQEGTDLLNLAEENRHVAETKLNALSSRSHLILTIYYGKSKLHLVDLAGSEKVHKTGAQGETLIEARKINYSLSCLGHVIQCLSQGQDHIPYRDSKLTKLLQDSLSTDCRTSIIVACSGEFPNQEETISSLRFAQRAKYLKIQQRMTTKKTYRDLELEVSRLQQELMEARSRVSLSNFQTRNNTESEITCVESLRLTYRSVASSNHNNNEQLKIPNLDEQMKNSIEDSQKQLTNLIFIFNSAEMVDSSKQNAIQDMLYEFKEQQEKLFESIQIYGQSQQIQQRIIQQQQEQVRELKRIMDYLENIDPQKQSSQLKYGSAIQMLMQQVEQQKENYQDLQCRMDKLFSHYVWKKNQSENNKLKLVASVNRKENINISNTRQNIKRSQSKNLMTNNVSQKYLRQVRK